MTGVFALSDVIDIARRHEASDAWGYDTVYDMREIVGGPTPTDLTRLADYVQRLVGARPRGRVAVVTSASDVVHAIHAYGAMNGGKLRIRPFALVEDAERWLQLLEHPDAEPS